MARSWAIGFPYNRDCSEVPQQQPRDKLAKPQNDLVLRPPPRHRTRPPTNPRNLQKEPDTIKQNRTIHPVSDCYKSDSASCYRRKIKTCGNESLTTSRRPLMSRISYESCQGLCRAVPKKLRTLVTNSCYKAYGI